MRKTKVLMNKPIYVGQAVLDLSKTLMYEIWYDYLQPKYKDKVKICYMDTDSFIIHVETEDFYKDIAEDANKLFDTSGYNEKDQTSLPVGKNKKIIGKFKDKLNGMIMTEFIVLGAKVYAYNYGKGKIKKKAKGTKKCVINKNLTME